ncbi:MAG: CopG family transcriptional regulator [Microcoleus sp. PH2017_10_PVI_O_A]|uniref:CopG family ribbon-helix-helix protein n=1 Tax=unclassified Microcoleus TaxID=2642155 RepID=UPI001E0F99F4|nr:MULTISPECIES: CopG family transcriptional regulator [unclassified Microcoleus]TAE80600.1 MAG: CopG family transcriptional regulator [Oscillatoriales cyanobacterium]MCC3408031.1 CopG family transcriptional regulator [Microcoleus sp. PH2017_10_PVI_O_A]MCC3462151.1 CopG family transcriptional regulator [Microcoleus sp. PH2017_11_PCY_U_A]MCC3480584.1 CopG family transcriptional regulator [Microcoleus sp. PH2017_12_PCY_D_A]MCC3561874.1 CopG family transcriptional regulator [Microcoleus sp. PH201
MSQENFTFLLDSEKKEALRAIANVTDRDLTYILNEAIASYLETYQWLLDEIHTGLDEAEAGDFASHDEVQAVFAKLTNGN